MTDGLLRVLSKAGKEPVGDADAVMDAALDVLPTAPADPLAGVMCVADLGRFTSDELRLLLGMRAHHRGTKRPRPADADADSGAGAKRPRLRRRRIVEDDAEDVVAADDEDAASMTSTATSMDDDAGTGASIRWLGDPLDDEEDEDDEQEEADGKDASRKRAEPTYSHVAVGSMLLTAGDVVVVHCEQKNNDDATTRSRGTGATNTTTTRRRALARIDRLQAPEWADVTWCYGRWELAPAARGMADEYVLTSDDDYCLSNHTDRISLHAVQAVERDIALIVHYDVETQSLSWLQDHPDAEDNDGGDNDGDDPMARRRRWQHQHVHGGRDWLYDAFVDCLAAVAERREQTTFWRRATDVFLRPTTDIGRASNPQRAVLREADYRFTFAPLDEAVTTRCFCCNQRRTCRHRIVSVSPPPPPPSPAFVPDADGRAARHQGGGRGPTSSSSPSSSSPAFVPNAAGRESKRASRATRSTRSRSRSSSANGDDGDGDAGTTTEAEAERYVGIHCYTRVTAVQRFLRHMSTTVAAFQSSTGMSHEQLRAAFLQARQCMDAIESTIAYKPG